MNILGYIQQKYESILRLSGSSGSGKDRRPAPERVCQFGHKVVSGNRLCSYGHRPV
jgi:hypothetical protein